MQVQWAGGDGRAAGRGAPQHRAAQRGGRPGLPLPPPTIQQDCSPSPPPANGLGAPPPHMTLVPRRSRPHSNRRPRGNAPPHPPSAPLTPPSPFCATEGAGSSAAVSSSREKAAGRGPERGILPAAEGSEAGGREGRKEGGEAAPAPSFSADLLPQRSAGSRDATGGSRESWEGRPRSGRRGRGHVVCAARDLRFPLRRHLALASRWGWLCWRGGGCSGPASVQSFSLFPRVPAGRGLGLRLR